MYTEFSGTLSEFGIVEINVSTNRLSIGDSEVYRSEARTNNLAFDLFRQGIRQLKFLPELKSDELYTLVLRFSEFSSVDEIDEDINTSLWRESLPNIDVVSVDIFTEKVFMADPEFTERFTQTIKDVVPGLFTFSSESELAPINADELVELVTFDVLDRADLNERKLRKQIEEQSESIRGAFEIGDDKSVLANHLVQQICALSLHPECPLQDAEIRGVLSRVLSVYVDHDNWAQLAAVMRTLYEMSAHRGGLEPYMVSRLERIGHVAAGRDTLELVAGSVKPDNTNFISWSRWFFTTAALLEAPQLLELVNGCQNSVGKELIKSLLRRQGTSSMDAWAERLRDPNGSIVAEVIDVIVESELGEQAKPLFLETLRHKSPTVRMRSVEVLTPFYDGQVREAVLPMITDPDVGVRLAVLTLAQRVRDRSIAPFFFQVAQSDDVFSYGEDELRKLFETLALLGLPKLLELFEERLDLESDSGVMGQLFKGRAAAVEDTPMRRAAISGLALLGDTKSVSLIRKVHRNAELSLAAHCEVALKMAERLRAKNDEEATDVLQPKALEDLESFAGLMGSTMLFRPETLGLTAARVVSKADDTPSVPHDSMIEHAPSESATVRSEGVRQRSDEHLYTAGEHLTQSRRVSGHPSLLTGGEYRILDLQCTLVSLQDAATRKQQTYSKTGAVEKKRPTAGEQPLDDLL
jgi:hypothetical protein